LSRSKVFVSKFQEIFNLWNSGFATISDFIISEKCGKWQNKIVSTFSRVAKRSDPKNRGT